MSRPLALSLTLLLTLLLILGSATGCASRTLVVQAARPTLADYVDWIHDPPRPQRSLGLAKRDQQLVTRYLEAVALGAPRHRTPEDYAKHERLRAGVVAAWSELREHFRAELLADLEAGRFVAFRLRVEPLLVLARTHFEELEADAAAGGHPLHLSYHPIRLRVPESSGIYEIYSDIHYGLPRLLKEHSLGEIVRDDRYAARLAEGLTAALFVAPAGLPARDLELAGEVLRVRQGLLRARAPDPRPATWGEAARYEARRAEVAADEAETHRDRALDAALDASVAAEGVAPPPERPAPLRKRRVR